MQQPNPNPNPNPNPMPPPQTKTMDDFFNSLAEHNPVIPDEVVNYYLRKSGFDCGDVRIKRLVALAAQKFISEVVSDSLHFCKLRQNNALYRDSKNLKDKKYVLATGDLASALKEYGIVVKKPEYYASNKAQPSTKPKVRRN